MMASLRYRLATPAQWSGGLLEGADAGAGGLTLPPSWDAGEAVASGPAQAAAVGPEGLAWWTDGRQCLFCLDPGLPGAASPFEPRARTVPALLARASKLVAGRAQLWSIDAGDAVLRAWERDPALERLAVDLGAISGATRLIDLAADGRDGVWALARAGEASVAVPVDCHGTAGPPVVLPRHCGAPRGLAAIADHLVTLDATGTLLQWVDPVTGAATYACSLAAQRPGGTGTLIAGDGHGCIAVAGVDAAAFGGGAWLAIVGADGTPRGTLDLAAPATGLALGTNSLIVASAKEMRRHGLQSGGETRRTTASLRATTPRLSSPPTPGSTPWLRAEATAWLPAGTTLRLSWAATDDVDRLAEIDEVWTMPGLDAGSRRARLDALLDWSAPVVFADVDASTDAPPVVCALPLHDVQAATLWMRVELEASAGSPSPSLCSLDVIHPGRSVMQYLPAVYRAQAEEPGDFLRLFVAALETTVQGLDRTIAGLGGLLRPSEAPPAFLDAAARWLGLPWDDALGVDAKRALLEVAPALNELRGTRAGLRALFAATLPGRRAHIVDVGVDRGFVRLGQSQTRACGDASAGAGGRLPALLAGWPPDALVLGRKACLGRGRLTDPARPPDRAQWLSGRIEVDIAATPAQRQAWSPWLRPLVQAMTPLGAEVALRWTNPHDRPPVPVLSEGLSLEAPLPTRLNEGATLNRSRLDGRTTPRLDRSGPPAGPVLL